MGKTDKRGRLEEENFSYRISKDNKVFILWHEKQVMILKGQESKKFIAKIENADEVQSQLIMAKITGNFKHGNEKMNKS